MDGAGAIADTHCARSSQWPSRGLCLPPQEMSSDEDVLFRCETGWYKTVLKALNAAVRAGIPYTHTNNPLCERQN